MDYKLIITKRAEELIDNLMYYMIFKLNNEQAAAHFLNSIEKTYDRLQSNPWQFPICHDNHLSAKGYHEATIHNMNYTIVFNIIDNAVYIMGVFHQLENFPNKL